MNKFKAIPENRKVQSYTSDFWNGLDVLCTDGSLWHFNSFDKVWERRA